MPNRKKTKKKTHKPDNGGDDDADAVKFLRTEFKIPDLDTRDGLKKVHVDFENICKKLDTAYKRYSANPHVQSAVVKIYHKIFQQDSVLRNRLFAREEVPERILPIVGPDTDDQKAYTMLLLFTTLTNVGAHDSIASYALFSDLLCRFLDANPDEHLAQHLVLGMMSPSVANATYGIEDTPYHLQILKKLDMPRILKTTVRCISKPFSCATCVMNGTVLIASATLAARTAFAEVPEALNILIAGLQSNNWSIRAVCLRALDRFHALDSEAEATQVDQQRLLFALASGSMPQELRDAQQAFGFERCASATYISYVQSIERAMRQYVSDHDLRSLGLKLYDLSLSSGAMIEDGQLSTYDETTRRFAPYTVPGMPFYQYKDAFAACTKAIREAGVPGEKDIANVLSIQAEMINDRGYPALNLAKKYIANGSRHAFHYLVLTLNGAETNEKIIQAAKKGMKCTEGLTIYVKLRLLERSVHHSSQLGLDKLQEARVEKSEELFQLGSAILMSAYEDAQQYLDEAPPDDLSLKAVTYWYILLRILLTEDPIISFPDDIKSALERLRLADGFSPLLTGSNSPRTSLRRTMEFVLDKLKESNTQYAEIFRRTEQSKLSQIAPHELRNIFNPAVDKMMGEMDGWARRVWNGLSEPRVDPLRRLQCSHCKNPSVGLRKCAKCSQARYCDEMCQRSHWPLHKKECKS